jgi:poly(3-hydroxybutyrate) depolymerase
MRLELHPIRASVSSCAVIASLLFSVPSLSPRSASTGAPPARRDASSPGRSRLTFTERSPFSSLEEVCRAMEIDASFFDAPDRAPAKYDLAKESFDVFVPPAYKPDAPHGLLVYLSAAGEEFPREWLDVLRRHKLICVSPVYRGESGSTPCRCGLALDAVHNLKQRYAIDEARVYISGFSAGANIGSQLIRGRPDVFRGGLFLMGGPFYAPRERPAGRPNPDGPRDPLPPKWKGEADVVRKQTSVVIVRAESDTLFTPQDGRADAEALTREGFGRVTFLNIPRGGHRPPNAAWFEKGIAALSAAPKTATNTGPPARP